MIGKVSPDDLRELVFERLGARSDAVLQGPAYGEDAAALELGDRTLVVSTDPISLAAERVGTLGVHVAANDVAASGADPAWLTVVVFVPADRPETLERVTHDLDAAAQAADVAVIGGHSEYSADLDRPTLSLTCLGVAERFVPTGGAEPGDAVLLTKGAGIEATAILATAFRDDLEGEVDAETLAAAEAMFEDIGVTREAKLLRGHATAMHDPTEGGLVDGLLELAAASGATVAVERDAVPVRPETRAVCDAAGVDPLATFGSGALVATVPEDEVEAAQSGLAETGVEVARIGTVRDGRGVLELDGQTITDPVRDDLYGLWD